MMKKLALVVLAAMLIVSAAGLTAFAATDPEDKLSLVVVGVLDTPFADNGSPSYRVVAPAKDYFDDDRIPFGETIYYPLLGGDWKGDSKKDGILGNDSGTMGNNMLYWISEELAIKSATINKKWDTGSSYVSSIEIVRKRVEFDEKTYSSSNWYLSRNNNKYFYFLAVKFKDSATTTEEVEISGTITLKKTGRNGFWADGDQGETSVTVDVLLDLGYAYGDDLTLTKTARIYNFSDTDSNGIGTSEEETIYLYGDLGYFEVNTKGQGKIIMSCNADYITATSDKYPNANLDFINCNGASFKRMGTLYINADEDQYLYERSGNTLTEPEYDYEDGYFVLRTRTLGNYVISDTRLRNVSSGASSGNNYDDESSSSSVSIVGSSSSSSVSVVVVGQGNSGTYVPINPGTGARP